MKLQCANDDCEKEIEIPSSIGWPNAYGKHPSVDFTCARCGTVQHVSGDEVSFENEDGEKDYDMEFWMVKKESESA